MLVSSANPVLLLERAGVLPVLGALACTAALAPEREKSLHGGALAF